MLGMKLLLITKP